MSMNNRYLLIEIDVVRYFQITLTSVLFDTNYDWHLIISKILYPSFSSSFHFPNKHFQNPLLALI